MKKTIKTLAAVLLSLVMVLPGTVKVGATGATIDWQTLYYDARDEISSLNNTVNSLQEQIRQLQNANDRPASTPKPSAPRVKLLSPQTVTVNRNETVDVELTIKNIGTSSASNVLTQVSPGADSPFTAEFLDNSNNAGNIGENGTKTMKLRITVDPDAEPGTYAVELTHAYKNRDADNSSETDSLYIRVAGKSQSPNIMLRNFAIDKPNLKPGDSFNLTATIENVGGGDAREVQLILDELDTDRIYQTSNPVYYSEFKAGRSDTASFTFTLTPRARSGAIPVSFKLAYYGTADKVIESGPFVYYVNVSAAGTEGRPAVEIRELSAPSGTISVDQNAQFTLQLFNNGGVAANNIRVSAMISDDTALKPMSANIQQINTLAAGVGKSVSFSFAPTSDAKSRSYTVGFHVEYETGFDQADGTPETFVFDQYAAVNVHNPDDTESAKGNKPKMIVSQYSVDPQIVRAGREFDLMLTFQNASGVKNVNNIKVTLTALETTEKKGSVFTPVGGSNTFYIDEIGPKGEVEQTLRMYTVPDADPRTYNIAVNFNYQDDDYNDYEETEQISINVKQVTRIETSEPFIPESAQVGQTIDLYFNVINSGRVTLSNLRVRVDGNFDTSEADMFIGNLGKGNTVNYDGRIRPLEAGIHEGAIVVYGEDDTGEIIEYSQPFTVNVMEMSLDDMGGGMIEGEFMNPDMNGDLGMGMPEENTSFFAKMLNFIKKPYFWGPAAVIVVTAVVVTVVLVRRKRRRIDFDE